MTGTCSRVFGTLLYLYGHCVVIPCQCLVPYSTSMDIVLSLLVSVWYPTLPLWTLCCHYLSVFPLYTKKINKIIAICIVLQHSYCIIV